MHSPKLMVVALLVGCGGSEPSRTNVEITIAPLTLPGIVDAEYRLTVRNAQPAPDNVVWDKTITSSRYGDGRGSATYVGACDASSNPNTVALELLSLTDDTPRVLGAADFANPTADGPIVLEVDCVENRDVAVTFDVAIMRAARQGFFDIAVNFDDIFCSAKVDCGDDGRSLLLHDPATGERAPTVVVGFACTSGDDDPTWLYLSDIVVDCPGEAPMVLDPGHATQGNQGPVAPAVYQWGLYRGLEFTQAAVDFDKCFTNVAIGLSTTYMDGKTCTLRATGTAAATLWSDGRVPATMTYPVVSMAVPVTGVGDALVCTPTSHAMDADGSQVVTTYVRPGDPRARFGQALDCVTGELETPGEIACGGSVPGSSEALTVAPVAGGLKVSLGALESPTYALPAELDGRAIAGVGDACCVDPCCE